MQKAIYNDLGLFTSMLQSSHSRGEINQLASELNALILKATKSEAFNHTCEKRTASASIKFTTNEINQMAKPFRSEIKRNGSCAHIIKSVNGNGYQYEIRYRRNGHNITVTHTDLKTAKQLFIASTFSYQKWAAFHSKQYL